MSKLQALIDHQNFKNFEEVTDFFEEGMDFKVKEEGDYYMLCYTPKSDLTNFFIRECNFPIIDKRTNKVVHYFSPKHYNGFEGTIDESDLISVDKISERAKIVMYIEGSLIKLFYDETSETWNVATSRSINAACSFWGSNKSFKELFYECAVSSNNCSYDEFLETLDKNCCYSFLIQHPENISTMKNTAPSLVNMNKVNTTSFKEEHSDLGFYTVDKNLEYILENRVNDYMSYMVYDFDKDGKVTNKVKIISKKYLDTQAWLSNQPDIGLSYIDILREKNKKLGEEFIKFFHDYDDIFTEINYRIEDAIDIIYDIYCLKYYKNEHKLHVDRKYYTIVRELRINCNKNKKKLKKSEIIHKILGLSVRHIAYVIQYKKN